MAYSGTTAASSVANPPIQIARGIGGGVNTSSTIGNGSGLWFYNSTNGTTELQSSTFFTDGYYIGMKAGDAIIFTGSTGSSGYVGVGQIGTVSTNGCGIASTGASMTSTFN
jgi:hypothetical protein